MSGFHRDIKGDQNHILHFREYADKDAREAAAGFDVTHLHKVALQKDDNTLWMLVDVNPVEWQGLGSSGGGHFPGEITMFWGVINSAGRPLDIRTGEPDLAWGYCDGRTYTAPDGRQVTTPNMRNRFPMCTADNGTGKGVMGGAALITQSAAQMKSHSHTVSSVYVPSSGSTRMGGYSLSAGAASSSRGTSGAGGASAMENRPPYIGVAFIMYL
ncbi:hypothetical protein [Halodesulfovibrio aestuarii]|uniref:Tail fiber protein n=1 Tax=Halodesulfovibrio aestuarii TaxID=126333 RepID=A0ABV4JX42_9BACT